MKTVLLIVHSQPADFKMSSLCLRKMSQKLLRRKLRNRNARNKTTAPSACSETLSSDEQTSSQKGLVGLSSRSLNPLQSVQVLRGDKQWSWLKDCVARTCTHPMQSKTDSTPSLSVLQVLLWCCPLHCRLLLEQQSTLMGCPIPSSGSLDIETRTEPCSTTTQSPVLSSTTA